MAFVKWRINRDSVGKLSVENAKHFIQSFAYNSGITVHVRQ
jgi:Imidazoleglycerol-phosphate dehydratase